jgi:hypothetical protein
MDHFITELNKVAEENEDALYEEEKIKFPLEVRSKNILIFFPKEEKEIVGDGTVVCDALLFDSENRTYTKIYSNLGIRETFNLKSVSTSTFLLDGYMAIQFKEPAKIDTGESTASFLYIYPFDETNLVESTDDGINKMIKNNENEYKMLLKISQGDYSDIANL